MKRSEGSSIILSKWIFFCVVLTWIYALPLRAMETRIQVSSYYDSNLQETLREQTSGAGLFARGELGQSYETGLFAIQANFLVQSYLDALEWNESKLIFLPEVQIQGHGDEHTQYRFAIHHFNKQFTGGARRIHWTEGEVGFNRDLTAALDLGMEYRHRENTVKIAESFQYITRVLSAQSRLQVSKRLFMDGSLHLISVTHRDYQAWDVQGDTALVRLLEYEEDLGGRAAVQLLYHHRVIGGIQVAYEKMNSNSVTGVYDQFLLYGYLSGRLGGGFFYHLAAQFTYKQYRYRIGGVQMGYHDPEGVPHNRAHIRIEREVGDRGTGYLQLNYLRNESLFNRRYFNKTFLEMGLKYDL